MIRYPINKLGKKKKSSNILINNRVKVRRILAIPLLYTLIAKSKMTLL